MSFYGIPEFLKDPKLLSLTNVFQNDGFEIRVVGGAVRDFILGENPKDIDLCTNATPDEMIAIAEKHGLHLIPTGLQHGTVTFVIDHEPFEVTTLRIDVETDGRHAEVEFTRDFRKDAERRDLTINAMSMDTSGTIYDYFDGVHHVRMNKAVFVGDAETRIREDYLRVLRYLRFFARMSSPGSEISSEMVDLFRQDHVIEGMKKLSGERIWMELKKIIQSPNAHGGIYAIHHCGLYDCFVDSKDYSDPVFYLGGMFMDIKSSIEMLFPKMDRGYDRFKEAMQMGCFASLIRPDVVEPVVNRLKLSADERKMFEYLNKVLWRDFIDRGQLAGIGDLQLSFAYEVACGVEPSVANVLLATRKSFGGRRDFFTTRMMVNKDGTPDYDNIDNFVPFTLNGADLIAKGVKPGKLMGDIIRMARNLWHEDGCKRKSEDLINLLIGRFDDLSKVVCVRETVVHSFKSQYNAAANSLALSDAEDKLVNIWASAMGDYADSAFAVIQNFNVRDGAHCDVLFANNKLAIEWKLTHEAK